MLAMDQVLNKGRYRIVNAFGQDGNGGMYEAYDTVSNTTVVLKETIGSLGKVTTTGQMEAINLAFFGGAKTLAEIRHESLVSVQDYFADIDRQYLVLEPVTGVDLSKYLQPGEDKPDLTDVLSWADQLLNALHYLHTHPTPIIHGDVRPENIKLMSDFKVKLLASCPHADDDANLITLAPIRSSNDNDGVNYQPLEQLWDGLDALSQRVILNHYDEESERWLLQPLSAATDLYSLGASLYAILTGTAPPDALDRSIAALEGKVDPLVSLAEVNPAVPAEVSNVIMKSMSLRREDRFYSAVILRQILHTAAAQVKENEPKTVHANVISPPPEPPQMVSNPDARRLEIEAERQHLEQERLQLEKRQAELDAEMAEQKAEQERLEGEAAEARQKLEEERLAAEAAQEQERLANEQREKEAAEAREAATKHEAEEQAKKESLLANSQPATESDEDDDDLLEVPETSAARPQPFADSSTVAKEETFDFVMSDSDHRPDRAKWRVPAIAVAAVLMVAAAFGIWKMTSAGSTAASTSMVSQPAAITQQTEVPAPADTQNSFEPTHASVVDPQSPASTPETAAPDKAPKQVQPTAAQEKPKKLPTTAPAKPPAPKKVTVDDLINDH